jgi:hypothetical protein
LLVNIAPRYQVPNGRPLIFRPLVDVEQVGRYAGADLEDHLFRYLVPLLWLLRDDDGSVMGCGKPNPSCMGGESTKENTLSYTRFCVGDITALGRGKQVISWSDWSCLGRQI